MIIHGTMPTLRYYFRLVTYVVNFLDNYSQLVEIDTEIQAIHKNIWNETLKLIA